MELLVLGVLLAVVVVTEILAARSRRQHKKAMQEHIEAMQEHRHYMDKLRGRAKYRQFMNSTIGGIEP